MTLSLVIVLGRLTWLVYIIGAVIGGRVSFASTDEHDEMDGELVCRSVVCLSVYLSVCDCQCIPYSLLIGCRSSSLATLHLSTFLHGSLTVSLYVGVCVCVCLRVLRLVDLTDSRLPQSGCSKLELALLSFFEQFRKIYIGDQVQKTSRVSAILCLLMLSDHKLYYNLVFFAV